MNGLFHLSTFRTIGGTVLSIPLGLLILVYHEGCKHFLIGWGEMRPIDHGNHIGTMTGFTLNVIDSTALEVLRTVLGFAETFAELFRGVGMLSNAGGQVRSVPFASVAHFIDGRE